jgi:hypothetical protein
MAFILALNESNGLLREIDIRPEQEKERQRQSQEVKKNASVKNQNARNGNVGNKSIVEIYLLQDKRILPEYRWVSTVACKFL